MREVAVLDRRRIGEEQDLALADGFSRQQRNRARAHDDRARSRIGERPFGRGRDRVHLTEPRSDVGPQGLAVGRPLRRMVAQVVQVVGILPADHEPSALGDELEQRVGVGLRQGRRIDEDHRFGRRGRVVGERSPLLRHVVVVVAQQRRVGREPVSAGRVRGPG